MAQRMKTAHQTEERRRRVKIRPAYVILLLAMALFSFKFIEKTRQLQQLNREAAALRSQNQHMMRDNARLTRDIKFYGTNQYLEQQARTILGFAKPGDITIRTQPPAQKPRTEGLTYRAAPTAPTWKQWWDSFFH